MPKRSVGKIFLDFAQACVTIYIMKKIFTIPLAAAVCLMCMPLFAGCKAQTAYTLNVAEDGSKYYTVRAGGYTANLKGVLEIPEYYGEGEDYAPVTEIGDKAFSGTSVTEIIIPKTINKIGTAAFAYNSSLRSVTFADGISLDRIGWGAFGYCETLAKIALPDSVTAIEGMAFYNCTSLWEINLPEGLQSIGMEAFENCYSLTSVSLPEGLTTIGGLAFYFSGLRSIIIPDSVRDLVTEESEGVEAKTVYGIGYGAFHSCTSLETAVVGSGITVLRSGVFGYCTSLKSIYLPAGLTAVEGAYYSGDNLLYGHPFHNNTSLTDVYYAGAAVQWAELLKNIDGTRKTEQGAVYSNSALIDATIHYETEYEG